jgi:bifunctional ADP-heptose synthase (sugar kinase/adenylyltransferase)
LGASTVDFAFVFRINGATLSRTFAAHNCLTPHFETFALHQPCALAALLSISRMNSARLEQILQRAPATRILVIGDLMLDEFVWGKVARISPEAPVPVVEVTGESFYPGGAANVARNLREFIQNVAVVGMVGKDPSGQQLRELLSTNKIDMSNSIEDGTFRTIVKTRIIAQHQQVVRVDREQIAAPSPKQTAEIVRTVREKIPEIDAIIFEDYGKGFLGSELVAQICRDAKAAGKIVAADPNPRHLIDWPGITVATPNRAEAFQAAGIPLGENGMMLFQKNEPPHHIPTKARQVFDVSGAGDTAIALFTLALCCGASPIEAAEIANHASAVVIGKLGTATVTRDELVASFHEDSERG